MFNKKDISEKNMNSVQKGFTGKFTHNDNLNEFNDTFDKPKKELTPEEHLKRTVFIILGVAGGLTALCATVNISSILLYNPEENAFIDTTRVDSIKNFISTETTDHYEEVIAKHNNEDKNAKLDIKTVYSSIGREYPFANILNKTQDNVSTMLCKFINTELKPAVISYKMANNSLPLVESDKLGVYEIDLSLLTDLINIRDESLTNYTYILSGGTESSSIEITVKEGDVEIPIILLDPSKFKIREINKNEVNIVQGEYSLILKPMEEFNNIRLQSISISGSKKSCTIVDTITNKVVQISI